MQNDTAGWDVTALVGAKLIDGVNKTPLECAVVVIEGPRITAVGDQDSVVIPAGAKEIDLTGRILMPGLINCHVHILLDGSPDPLTALRQRTLTANVLVAAQHAESTLRAGITTVRDLGGMDGLDLELKKAINDGLILGPRMLVCGKVICMTGGHGYAMGREVDGPHEARKGAREQLRAGADVIKLIATGGVMTRGVEPHSAQLTYEEMRAAVEEAEKAGKTTASHAQGAQGIKNAVRAGIDSVEHGFYLDSEAIDMMLERGTVLVPTLAVQHHMVEEGAEFGIPAFILEKAKRALDAQVSSYMRAHQAGVRIAAGNDGGTPLNRADNLASELERMVAAGMSPAEALTSAHKTAAELLHLEDQIGTVEPGKLADLVVLEADPLADISAVRQVHAVFKAGQQIAV